MYWVEVVWMKNSVDSGQMKHVRSQRLYHVESHQREFREI